MSEDDVWHYCGTMLQQMMSTEVSKCIPGLMTSRYSNCISYNYLCLTALRNMPVIGQSDCAVEESGWYRGEAPVPHLVDGCSCDYHKLFMNEPTEPAIVSVVAAASFSFSHSARPSSASAFSDSGEPSSSRAFPVAHNHQCQHEQVREVPARKS